MWRWKGWCGWWGDTNSETTMLSRCILWSRWPKETQYSRGNFPSLIFWSMPIHWRGSNESIEVWLVGILCTNFKIMKISQMQDRNIDYQPTTTTWETRLFQVVFKRVPKFRGFQIVFKRVPKLRRFQVVFKRVPKSREFQVVFKRVPQFSLSLC